MAGTPAGAPAPLPFAPPVPAVLSTRTRRYHGAHLVGGQILRVYSSRRPFDFDPVIVTIGDCSMLMTGRMSASDARGVAQALVDAALAAERQGGAT